MNGFPRIAITGGHGFLGWHAACRLRSVHGIEPVRIGRDDFNNSAVLDEMLNGVDAVLHVAGINRASNDEDVESGNLALAQILAEAVSRRDRPLDVSYANSIQATLDNPYGRGKAKAAEVLSSAVTARGGRFSDLRLPNIFGEHGRPGYNSFVATFAHQIAIGVEPTMTGDREVALLHVQDAAAALIGAILGEASEVLVPRGSNTRSLAFSIGSSPCMSNIPVASFRRLLQSSR